MKIIFSMLKFFLSSLMSLFIVALSSCGNPKQHSTYEPAVIFRGYFNGKQVYLPGHKAKPNTAQLIGDTIRMYFYSEDYSDDAYPWNGDQLRLDIFGYSSDSIIANDRALMKLSRFTYENATYLVCPADTIDKNLILKIRPAYIPSNDNDKIELISIFARLRNVRGGGGPAMEVKDGHIEGRLR